MSPFPADSSKLLPPGTQPSDKAAPIPFEDERDYYIQRLLDFLFPTFLLLQRQVEILNSRTNELIAVPTVV